MLRIAKIISVTLVCFIFGVMLAWQYKSINNNSERTALENQRMERLTEQLVQLQKMNNDLEKRLAELKEENDELLSAATNGRDFRERLNKELMDTKIFAGLVPVKGPGLVITIDDGPIFNVQDSDLLLIINELRAADAQAISVNEERVVPMTEFRSTTDFYVMVNGNRLTVPFVIKAIGDPEKMEHSLKMIGGVIDQLETYEFKISVQKSNDIIIPAVRDDGSVIRIDLMSPVTEGQ